MLKFFRFEKDSVINLLKTIVDNRLFMAIIGLFLLILLLATISPYFLTVSNILNILRQISIISIVSVGMTYVIITGGIDLSVGSVLALSAVIAAVALKHGINMPISIVIGLIIGTMCGFLNGILITTRIKMPPFIATLVMMSMGRGFSLVITSGRPIYGLPKQFGFIAGGYILGIPFPVIIMIFIYIIGYLYLTRVRTGMYCYAVGGNQEAARLAGVDIKKIKISAYVVSGISASIGGTILSSRLISIEPLAGLGYELDAIAAAVIGGANLMGGEGNLIGTLIGAITMGILRNGLNLLNVSAYWQQVAVGLVIAAVVSVNALRKE
jgi:ribose transport system permease protein